LSSNDNIVIQALTSYLEEIAMNVPNCFRRQLLVFGLAAFGATSAHAQATLSMW
jgi:hypothetical protein